MWVRPRASPAGFIAKRDHGNLVFVDLRDHHGLTQCVIDAASPVFPQADTLRPETVITVKGEVVPRAPDAVNPRLATGAVELAVRELTVLSGAEPLPLQVASDADFPEETRLRYRFLDLRRKSFMPISSFAPARLQHPPASPTPGSPNSRRRS